MNWLATGCLVTCALASVVRGQFGGFGDVLEGFVGGDTGEQLKKMQQEAELRALLTSDPDKGSLVKPCGRHVSQLVYGLTASAPVNLQFNSDYQRLRSLLIGYALECQVKREAFDKYKADDLAKQAAKIIPGAPKPAAIEEQFTPGMCELEHKLCGKYLSTFCKYSSEHSVYDVSTLQLMVKQIRYLPGVKAVCVQNDRKKMIEIARNRALGVTASSNSGIGGMISGLLGGGGGGIGGLLGR